MDSQHSVCFVTAVNPDDDIQPVRLLLASLRECGGSLKGSPVYVFSPEPGRLEQAAALPGVEVMQLEQPGPAGITPWWGRSLPAPGQKRSWQAAAVGPALRAWLNEILGVGK